MMLKINTSALLYCSFILVKLSFSLRVWCAECVRGLRCYVRVLCFLLHLHPLLPAICLSILPFS